VFAGVRKRDDANRLRSDGLVNNAGFLRLDPSEATSRSPSVGGTSPENSGVPASSVLPLLAPPPRTECARR